MGVLRLGFLMRYFSPAVVTGFISGAAFGASVCSQLPSLFGVRTDRVLPPSPVRRTINSNYARLSACAYMQVTIPATNYCWMIIYYVCAALPQTKWLAITMSILTIAIIVVVRKYACSRPSERPDVGTHTHLAPVRSRARPAGGSASSRSRSSWSSSTPSSPGAWLR